MVFGLKYYLDEAQYGVTKVVRSVQAKLAQNTVRMTMGGGAAAVATKFSAEGASAVGTGQLIASAAGGLATAGIGIGIDVYQNQMQFRRHERQLTELYRPQIASILGKERGGVAVDDLYAVAAGNPTLDTELQRHRDMRNIKNVAAVGSTLLAFGVVFAAIALIAPLGALAISAAGAGLLSGPGLLFAATAGGIGFASFQLARRGIKKIGMKVAGLDVPSAEDRIFELSKQHRREEVITPSQVLGVYATALPEIGTSIEQQFGRKFDDLPIEKQRAAVAAFDTELGLAGVTTALNEDRMNVRELTFLVHGQSSGVYPDPSLKDKLKTKALDALDPVQDKLVDIGHGAADKLQDIKSGASVKIDQIQDWRETRRQSKMQDKVAKALEEGRELPKEALEAAPESYWQSVVETQRAQKGAERGPNPAGVGRA